MRRTSSLLRRIQVVGELTKVPQGTLPAVGVTASIEHTFDSNDVATFARLSGDTNPLHIDAEFASRSSFGKPVVHGILCTSLFPTIFGATFDGSIYISQNVRFHKPIFVGEAIQAQIEVLEVKKRVRLLLCSTKCLNSQGEIAISGEAKVLLPKLKEATN